MRLTYKDIQRIATETEEREIEILDRAIRRLLKDDLKSPYQEYLDSCAFGDWDDDGFPGDR